MINKKRILTGDRTTGKLHIGHYVGSLKNRVMLQNEYDTFIILADVQALTTHFDTPENLKKYTMEVALDNLSVGLDPEVSTIFIQSMVPQIAELTMFYSMFTSVNVLRHNPTIKSEALQYGYEDLNYGFLGYPISQAADITFCKADVIPGGEDQLPHIELTRKIVRRFNTLYKPVFKEPEAILSDCPRLCGIDGNAKMGKSLNNAIYLSDSEAEVNEKIKSALTDANRISLKDKGDPEVCAVYKYHCVFNKGDCANINEMCRNAQIGCVACKKRLAQSLNETLTPIREKRNYYENNLNLVNEILYSGTKKAQKVGAETMREVRNAMSLDYFKEI